MKAGRLLSLAAFMAVALAALASCAPTSVDGTSASSAASVTAASQAGVQQRVDPEMSENRFRAIALQPGDKVAFDDKGDDVIVDITSEKGIGSVEIERLGLPPGSLRFHFQLKGLEELRLTWADARLFVHMSSTDGTIREEIGLRDGTVTSIDKTSPYWAPVHISGEDPQIPLRDAFVVVTSPLAFIQTAPERFSLRWIDFYR